jgi:outer membrane protein TolC
MGGFMMGYRNVIGKMSGMLLFRTSNVLALLVLTLLIAFTAGSSGAADGDEQGGDVELSMSRCIELMLSNNLDLKVERYNPTLQENEISKERAAFDPVARFSLQKSKFIISPTTLLDGVGRNQSFEQKTMDYEASLSKKLITGGLGQLKFTTNKFDTNSLWQYDSPTYFTNLVFSLNQPLLRNFGIDLNKSRIILSSNNREISQARLMEKTASMITTLQGIYWNLYLSKQVLEVKKDSLQLARDLKERNSALVEVGKLPSVEILRAETGIATREEDVIVAESATRDLEDVLKETLNLPFSKQIIILKDKPALREFHQQEIKAYLSMALENRPEYKEAKMHCENVTIANKVAKNAMLPIFDVQASYGVNATKGHYDSSVKGIKGGGDYSWLVGFKMEVPLGNRWAKNNYQQSRLELEKTETSIASLERKIELEIIEAVREIETNQKRISATREARRMSEKNLEAEDERMDLGMSTSIDVLRAQELLELAQVNETRAIVDYINSLNSLEKVLGTLFKNHQIQFQENS